MSHSILTSPGRPKPLYLHVLKQSLKSMSIRHLHLSDHSVLEMYDTGQVFAAQKNGHTNTDVHAIIPVLQSYKPVSDFNLALFTNYHLI